MANSNETRSHVATSRNPGSDEARRTIVTTRLFDAPRELV
jgi:hypothetical protein